jgi:anti-sigma B factor antagonist
MEIHEQQVGNVTLVTINGRLTASDPIGMLHDKVNSLVFQGRRQIVLDLAKLGYIDSSGLGELVSCLAFATRQGGSVVLTGITSRMRDVLVMTKLLTVFDCYDTEEQAVASLERVH